MIDRKWLYGGGIATLIGGAFLGIRSLASNSDRSGEEEKVLQPTSALNSELERGNLRTGDPETETGYKEYTLTGTTVLYKSVSDPEGRRRDCVQVGSFSTGNTLFGATMAVGPDSNYYIDVPGGTIHSSDGTVIGYFDQSQVVKWEDAPGANSDSIVCAN